MTSTLDPLLEATRLLERAWGGAGSGAGLSRAQLVAVNDAIGQVRRTLDAVHAEVATGIARESRRELGPQSLAKQQGFRTAAHLIATTTGSSTGDAHRLVKVGEATAPRTNLLGKSLPAKFPAVRAALTEGRIGAAAADLVVTFLDRMIVKVGRAAVAEAEELLVEKSPGLSLDEVRRMITRLEAHLDPDGVAPREEELRARASLSMFERDGMLHLNAILDPARGAAVKTAIEGYVSAEFAAKREGRDPAAPDADRRTVQQIQADALVHLAEHALTCLRNTTLNGATVVVRVNAADLETGTGFGLIDGITQPVSIDTVRRMAGGGSTVTWVCGDDGEILNWGRERRLFTRAQRLALTERDGGCAFCGLPPGMTKAHHIDWWARDHGTTDLTNGILLCETCHHLIHDNGWGIRIDGTGIHAKVWFLPPPGTGSAPRLGGRARTEHIA
jgi:5-methylcytosine-specific restriction protein A